MYSTIRCDSSLYSQSINKKGMPRVHGSQFVASSQQSFDISTERPIKLFPLSNYSFGTKDPIPERDVNSDARLLRLQDQCLAYESSHPDVGVDEAFRSNPGARLADRGYRNDYPGTCQSIDAVLVVHEHNLPHILLLQIGQTYFKLPGGELEHEEDAISGLKRYLRQLLERPDSSAPIAWRIEDLVGQWWRPNFDSAQYPYIPAHVTKPKEHRRLYLVQLPERATFAVPRNYRLVAAPLFELFDNQQNYGPVIASLPQALSRFSFNFE
jgi:cleavage and polyadenylation specificity factor subunit 5